MGDSSYNVQAAHIALKAILGAALRTCCDIRTLSEGAFARCCILTVSSRVQLR